MVREIDVIKSRGEILSTHDTRLHTEGVGGCLIM